MEANSDSTPQIALIVDVLVDIEILNEIISYKISTISINLNYFLFLFIIAEEISQFRL